MKHRTAATTLLLAAALLAAAAPANAQSVPPPGTLTRHAPSWTADTFPDGNANILEAVRSGGSTWAVGIRTTGQGRGTTAAPIVLTRDGADRAWHELALPKGLGASSVSPDDSGGTWVTDRGPGRSTPVGHYRGGHWQVQDAPLNEHATGGGISGIAATGRPDDTWAVGYYQPDDFLTFYGVIDHWDGTSWQSVPTPALDTDYWTLSAVVANGPSDVWASGTIGTPEGWPRPLLLHYDGRTWSKAAAPDLDSRYGDLTHLVATGPNDIWAAGFRNNASHDDRPLLAHYDGRTWTYQETGIAAGRLNGLTRTPDGVAVVGSVNTDGVTRPTGARLTRHGWEPLDIPQGTAPAGRFPRSVVAVGDRLSVIGLDLPGEAADGSPLPPTPFSVTR
ncbi:hypothetical protein [Kitasatospora sp. NPDC057198]|uniref:hypothetical protein n=1 Tax=Kitasatospora sp. NPDC057198 TaxID=3346046 RepID=UPI003624F3EF